MGRETESQLKRISRSSIQANKTHDSYLWQSNVGNNDSVQSTGGVPQGLVLVTTGVVLVLVGFAALVLTLPGHRAVGDADVALGGDGGGLLAEVPIDTNQLATDI